MDLLQTGAGALGIHLGLAQLEQFRRYYDEILDWNGRVNLTSVTVWEKVQTAHFLDSLSVALVIPRESLERGRFVDIGSGAGFPGIPLKVAFPGLRATLIESTAKKATFLAHIVEMLGLGEVDVRTGRAETLAHEPILRESFDVALVRAVASVAVLAELTLPLCRVGGVVVAHKKMGIEDELAQAQTAIEALGGALAEVREVVVPGLTEPRALVVLEKVAPTPERYPRRPGIPAKRPL